MITLKLDLDGKNGVNNMVERLWVCKYLGLVVKNVQIHHTTNGYHARLKCDNSLDAKTILLFESILGDDFRRVVCNYLRTIHGTKRFDGLFKEKWKTNPIGEIVLASKEHYDKELSEKIFRMVQVAQ